MDWQAESIGKQGRPPRARLAPARRGAARLLGALVAVGGALALADGARAQDAGAPPDVRMPARDAAPAIEAPVPGGLDTPGASGAASAGADAGPRPVIVVHPGDRIAHRVAVQRFADPVDPERAARLRRALEQAIAFTSSMRPLPEDAFLGPRDSAALRERRDDCADWRAGGTDVLVEGAISPAEEGLVIDFAVWDVAKCTRLMRRSYTRPQASLPRVARRIGDDVVEAVTGLRGAAATEIAFVSTRTGRREITVMDSDGANVRSATRADSIKVFPDWLPDAAGILYTAFVTGLQPALYVTARTPGVRAGPILQDVLPGRPKYRGTIAPDGRTIAFVTSVADGAEIYSVGSDGRGLRRLTFSPAIDVGPAWSPDGTRIVFVSDRSGSPQLFVMNRNGTGKRRLTYEGAYNVRPAWSPDGRWIVYTSRIGAQFDVWLIDPDGEVNFPLVEHPRSDEGPSWSPDGRKIVFSSTRRGRADLYTVDRTGENLKRLTRGMGDNTDPDWGPFAR